MRLQHNLYNFRLSGWLAICLLAAAGGTAAIDPALIKAYPDQSLATGNWASTYQAGFDKALPLRPSSTALMALINYTAFREGRPGVLVGREGWLFSSEEMTPLTDPDAVIAQKAAYVVKASSDLQARGTRVIIALIPAKMRIYQEKAGSYRLLPQLQGTYDRLLQEFRTAGIEAPDLRRELAAGKRRDAMFLRTDTHWTPQGAAVTAQALSRVIGAKHNWVAVPSRFEAERPFVHDGDLNHFLPLGMWKQAGPSPDLVAGGQYVPTSAITAQSLLGGGVAPVTLVGTSYSFNPKWRFEGALKQALSADVLNVSQEGRGPFKPMQAYLDDMAERSSPFPEIVIWEMPERYFWSTDKTVGLP